MPGTLSRGGSDFPTGFDEPIDLEGAFQFLYSLGDLARAAEGPVAAPPSEDELFGFQSYYGGATVLYALRQEIGAAAFDRLERRWVQRYRDGVASTHDFINLASQVAGRDLTDFLEPWLYGDTTPPMPGHPDWTVEPVSSPQTQAKLTKVEQTLPAVRRR